MTITLHITRPSEDGDEDEIAVECEAIVRHGEIVGIKTDGAVLTTDQERLAWQRLEEQFEEEEADRKRTYGRKR